MSPYLFRRCVKALYGRYYVGPAAAELDVRADKIQRMASGKDRVYPSTAEKLVELVRARRGEVVELMQDLEHSGSKIDGA